MNKRKSMLTGFVILAVTLMFIVPSMARPVKEKVVMDAVEYNTQQAEIYALETMTRIVQDDIKLNILIEQLSYKYDTTDVSINDLIGQLEHNRLFKEVKTDFFQNVDSKDLQMITSWVIEFIDSSEELQNTISNSIDEFAGECSLCSTPNINQATSATISSILTPLAPTDPDPLGCWVLGVIIGTLWGNGNVVLALFLTTIFIDAGCDDIIIPSTQY